MHRFKNRSEFISNQTSEKITLVHLHAKQRLYSFTIYSGSIYKRVCPFVVELKQNDMNLIKVSNLAAVTAGTFFYDIKNGILYTHLSDNSNPAVNEVIATYRFFYSDVPCTTTWDLNDISEEVPYLARIKNAPGYKTQIGIDQNLTSLIGEGTLNLISTDGYFDSTYDKLIYDNQKVMAYSWNRQLKASEAKIIYRGRVTDKTFSPNDGISFKVKDLFFDLTQNPPLKTFKLEDGVNNSALGRYKRLVYGRVDGLQCQGTDQIGDGYSIGGTITFEPNSNPPSAIVDLANASQYIFQNDTIFIESLELSVEKIDFISGIQYRITLSDTPDYFFSNAPFTVKSDYSFNKNRTFLAAGHECTQVTTQIVKVNQYNRVVVSDTTGLFPGDFIEFQSTGERLEIKKIAPGNIIVLRQNMVTLPTIGSSVIRQPIQEVYYNGLRLPSDGYTILNTGKCGLTIDSDVEQRIAKIKTTGFNATFTSGSKVVSTFPGDVNITEIIKPRDLITDEGNSQYYLVSYIDQNNIYLTTNYIGSTVTEKIDYKSVDYISDDSKISVNILGKTEDNTATGNWISTVAQAVKDLLESVNITDLNSTSFTNGSIEQDQLISYVLPKDQNSKTLPQIKSIIDDLNQSVKSALVVDNNLLLSYEPLLAYIGTNLKTISDHDVIDWKLKNNSGKIYSDVDLTYRFQDIDNNTLDNGNQTISQTNQFVKRYIETSKTSNLTAYIYEDFDAQIQADRHLYYNQLNFSTIEINSDLRLEDIEIGQRLIINFKDMYNRLGDNTFNKKIATVIAKTVTGENIRFILSDLGNIFNTSSYITNNVATDWVVADSDQKLVNGYITNNQGLVNDEEWTANTHLIS